MNSLSRLILAVSVFFVALSAHAAPGYRGFQIALDIDEAGVQELADNWNVNIVRIQIGADSLMDGTTGAAYITMMENVFTEFDRVLPFLQARNMKIIFALYSPPGGFSSRTAPSHYAMFSNADLQEEFISMWRTIMNRYGTNSSIYAFDLLNEPAMRKAEVCSNCRTWHELLEDTVAAVREINPSAPLMVKSLYGDPSKLSGLPQLNDANVIYSYHAYPFLSFQQAGIYDRPADAARPSAKKIKGSLLKLLGKYFQKHYKAYKRKKIPSYPPRISVGEFGVSGAATNQPGQFMEDLITVLEGGRSFPAKKRRGLKFNFQKEVTHESWINHAYDEAEIWDPRYNCTSESECTFVGDTDRSTVLKKYFSKNP